MAEETIYVKKRRSKKSKAKKAAAAAKAKKPRAKKAERLPRSVRALLGYLEGSQMKIGGQSSLSRAKLQEFQRFATHKQLPPAPMQQQPEIYRVLRDRDVAEQRVSGLRNEVEGVQVQLQRTEAELAPLKRAMSRAIANPFPADIGAAAPGARARATDILSRAASSYEMYGTTPPVSEADDFAYSYNSSQVQSPLGYLHPAIDPSPFNQFGMFAGTPYRLGTPIARGSGFTVASERFNARLEPHFESGPRSVGFNEEEYVGGGGGPAMSYGNEQEGALNSQSDFIQAAGAPFRPVQFDAIGGGGGPAISYGNDQEGAFDSPSDYRQFAGAPFRLNRSAGFEEYMENLPTNNPRAVDKLYKEPKAPRKIRILPKKIKTPEVTSSATKLLVAPMRVSPTGFGSSSSPDIAVAGGGAVRFRGAGVSPDIIMAGGSSISPLGEMGNSAAEFRKNLAARLGMNEKKFKELGVPVRTVANRTDLQKRIENLRAAGKNSSQIIDMLKRQ